MLLIICIDQRHYCADMYKAYGLRLLYIYTLICQMSIDWETLCNKNEWKVPVVPKCNSGLLGQTHDS